VEKRKEDFEVEEEEDEEEDGQTRTNN